MIDKNTDVAGKNSGHRAQLPLSGILERRHLKPPPQLRPPKRPSIQPTAIASLRSSLSKLTTQRNNRVRMLRATESKHLNTSPTIFSSKQEYWTTVRSRLRKTFGDPQLNVSSPPSVGLGDYYEGLSPQLPFPLPLQPITTESLNQVKMESILGYYSLLAYSASLLQYGQKLSQSESRMALNSSPEKKPKLSFSMDSILNE